MSKVQKNPCEGCMVNCCKAMSGLVVSKEEFERHFERHKAGIIIQKCGKVFILRPKEGRVCPHFENGGCRIYKDRPIDCRVYPYVISRVFERGTKAKLIFHTRSDCPQKKLLYSLISEAEVRELVLDFGKKVYGRDKKIIVQYEKNAVLRLLNRLEGIGHRLLLIAGHRKCE